MKIAIASGKGGTGKTMLATNLAYTAAHLGWSTTLLDCDVEGSNAHLFLRPEIQVQEPVNTLVPEVDAAKCNLCGKCGEICQYSAIVPLGKRVLVYPELCHACGGCQLVCPTGAIREKAREIGRIEIGQADGINFVRGSLAIGELMSPTVIKAVKRAGKHKGLTLIDSPPGTSCPVVESVRDADLVVLVTEPTPFGLHDLRLAVNMLRTIKRPFGVVVNRAHPERLEVHRFCREQDIPILSEIPDDRRIAESYSRGELVCRALPEYLGQFKHLLEAFTLRIQPQTLEGMKGGGE